ncbi:MAG: FlgD immunoglobulin-like domain containing protein, partial [bacterium]
ALLSFDTTLTAGTLTANWTRSQGQENTPGIITIGGLNFTLPITTSGVLINIVFDVKSNAGGCDTLKLRNFSDDIKAATTMDGVVCAPPPNEVDQTPALPQQFTLLANYPNPFNPTTIIRYDLPKNVHVKLVIYDLLGAKIRTLIDADETAGFKHLAWDGIDDSGARVASGVYLYRIEADDFAMTRKLTLMK